MTLPTFSKTLRLHVTPCNLVWSSTQKSHWVTLLMDHSVCVAHHLLWFHHPPFHFCAVPLPFHSISALFHLPFPMPSIFHIPPLSPFCDLLSVARLSDPYVVALRLGGPWCFLFGSPLQGMHSSTVLYLSNILGSPLQVFEHHTQL